MTKIKTFILSIWNKFSDSAKIKIISIFNTFGSAFLLALSTAFITHEIEWTLSFFIGVIYLAFREALKAVVSMAVPKRLGGRK